MSVQQRSAPLLPSASAPLRHNYSTVLSLCSGTNITISWQRCARRSRDVPETLHVPLRSIVLSEQQCVQSPALWDLEHDHAGLHYIHICIFVCLNLSECTQIAVSYRVKSHGGRCTAASFRRGGHRNCAIHRRRQRLKLESGSSRRPLFHLGQKAAASLCT